eukprot:m.71054 g.71054  ORF g.71054 m.71054 type:complete len:295 (+) comp24313_c0_seq2:216-1100(+)
MSQCGRLMFASLLKIPSTLKATRTTTQFATTVTRRWNSSKISSTRLIQKNPLLSARHSSVFSICNRTHAIAPLTLLSNTFAFAQQRGIATQSVFKQSSQGPASNLITAVGLTAAASLIGVTTSTLCEENDKATTEVLKSTPDGSQPNKKKLLQPVNIQILENNPKLQEMFHSFSVAFGDQVDWIADTGVPSQITAGFAAGFCMGFAVKKSLKLFAIGFGILLFFVQFLSYSGYIQTDWKTISEDFIARLDTNGDGKVDKEDMQVLWGKVSEVVGYNLPAGSGWLAGWIAGLKTG